jgi:hypothetical protein
MYSDELLAPWLAVLRDRLPPLDLVDMHVHVGLSDPAGLLATEEEALASLALGAHARGQDGGQELLMALDGCAAGADGPDGDVLRAMRGLLE